MSDTQETDAVEVINVYREDLDVTKFQIDLSKKTVMIIMDKADDISE
jgi:hypothetical protein